MSDKLALNGGPRTKQPPYTLTNRYGEEEVVAFGHTGSDGTHAWVFPKQQAMVFYFTQSRGNSTGIQVEEVLGELLLGVPYDANEAAPPFEQYLGTVAEFDSLPEASQRDLGKRNTVIACLASFARTTQTWGLAPPLNEVPGLHFVAIDWQAKNGAHVLRSGLAIGDAPLTKEDLAEIASIQLGLHLARCPQESPIDF